MRPEGTATGLLMRVNIPRGLPLPCITRKMLMMTHTQHALHQSAGWCSPRCGPQNFEIKRRSIPSDNYHHATSHARKCRMSFAQAWMPLWKLKCCRIPSDNCHHATSHAQKCRMLFAQAWMLLWELKCHSAFKACHQGELWEAQSALLLSSHGHMGILPGGIKMVKGNKQKGKGFSQSQKNCKNQHVWRQYNGLRQKMNKDDESGTNSKELGQHYASW